MSAPSAGSVDLRGVQATVVTLYRCPIAVHVPFAFGPANGAREFLRELRRLPTGNAPKVVFCTTENDVGYIARAMHAGADEYIMKPFDKEIMTAKFQEVGLV